MGCTQSDSAPHSSYKPNKGLDKIPSGNVQRRKSQLQRSPSSSSYKGDDEPAQTSRASNTKIPPSEQRRPSTAASSTLKRQSSAASATSQQRRPSDGTALQKQKSDRRPSMGNPTKCKKCGESVGKTEEAKDSKGTVFHTGCLKCTTCGIKLTARECVSSSTIRMTSAQYVQQDRELFCNKHAPTVENARRKNSIKGQDINEKAVDERELSSVGSNRRTLNKEAKEVLEETGGFSADIKCGRCGGVIEKTQNFTVSGMMRYHEVCPSKDELAKADKSIRFFIDKLPDRLPTVFTCDAKSKKPHTFLFVRDNNSLKNAQKQATKGDKQVSVTYVSDTSAHDQVPRNFVIPEERAFDLQVRGLQINYSFDSATSPGSKLTPTLSGTKLKIMKQASVNGIVHTVEGYFLYDETKKDTPLMAEKIVLTFEKSGSDGQDDPLGTLRLKRRDTSNYKSNSSNPIDAMVESADASVPLPKPKNRLERYDSSTTTSGTSTPPSPSFPNISIPSSKPLNPPTTVIPRQSITPEASQAMQAPAPPPNKPKSANAPPLPKNKPGTNPIDMNMV